jgi:hypothetical protein
MPPPLPPDYLTEKEHFEAAKLMAAKIPAEWVNPEVAQLIQDHTESGSEGGGSAQTLTPVHVTAPVADAPRLMDDIFTVVRSFKELRSSLQHSDKARSELFFKKVGSGRFTPNTHTRVHTRVHTHTNARAHTHI